MSTQGPPRGDIHIQIAVYCDLCSTGFQVGGWTLRDNSDAQWEEMARLTKAWITRHRGEHNVEWKQPTRPEGGDGI